MTPAAVREIAVFSCRMVLLIVVEDDAHKQADYGATGCEEDAVVFNSGGTVRGVISYVGWWIGD